MVSQREGRYYTSGAGWSRYFRKKVLLEERKAGQAPERKPPLREVVSARAGGRALARISSGPGRFTGAYSFSVYSMPSR